MKRGLKQECPLAALLYLVYVEPLHLKIKSCIAGTRLGSEILYTLDFIDDIIVFIDNDHDFISLQQTLANFELATNSELNRKKTKLLAHVAWRERFDLPYDWLKADKEAKILGITFHNDYKQTNKIKLN